MKFKEFYYIHEALDINSPLGVSTPMPDLSGAIPSIWNGGDINSTSNVLGAELELPTVSVESRIKYINDKVNPIIVFLDNKMRLFFSFDKFRSIKGEPRVGKMMRAVLLRRKDDNSSIPSKIQSATCF